MTSCSYRIPNNQGHEFTTFRRGHRRRRTHPRHSRTRIVERWIGIERSMVCLDSQSRSYGVIENYLVIRLIDCHPLTRSYITTDTPIVPFSLSCCPFFSRRFARAAFAEERRLSGVRSANKSNTPRFVQRESSSFTIHEFIMGTTEGTAGSLLLIYRYVSLATDGPRLPWCTLLARKLSLPPHSFVPYFRIIRRILIATTNFNGSPYLSNSWDFTWEYNL